VPLLRFKERFRTGLQEALTFVIFFNDLLCKSDADPYTNIYKLSTAEVNAGVSFVHSKIDPQKLWNFNKLACSYDP